MSAGNVRATHTGVRVCLQGTSGRHIHGFVCVYRECHGDTYIGSCVSPGYIRATYAGVRVCLQGISGRRIQGFVCVYRECQEVVAVVSRRS